MTNPSAPLYEPDLWNDRTTPEQRAEFLKQHRDLLVNIKAVLDTGRLPDKENRLRYQMQVERGQDFLLKETVAGFVQVDNELKGDEKRLAAKFGITPEKIATVRKSMTAMAAVQGYQDFANCYTYAMDDRDGLISRHKTIGGDEPGTRARSDNSPVNIEKDDAVRRGDYVAYQKAIIDGMIADGAAFAGKNAGHRDGFYRVAAYSMQVPQGAPGSAPLFDMHFVREDRNGGWSHKPGPNEVTRLDMAERLITDPRKANLGGYEFLGYAYVPAGGLDVGKHDEPASKPGSQALHAGFPNIDQMASRIADAKSREAAGVVLDRYQGEKVLFISDANHFRTGPKYDLAAAVAAAGRGKGITGVGFEELAMGQQAMLDGYMKGDINRREFLDFFKTTSSTHPDSVQDREKTFGKFADMMDSGIRVYGLGNLAGSVSGLETEGLAQQAEATHVGIAIDYMKFKRDHQSEIEKNPAMFLDKYLGSQESRTDLSPLQQETLKVTRVLVTDNPANPQSQSGQEWMSRPENVEKTIRDVYFCSHPLYSRMQETIDKIKPPSPDDDFVTLRQRSDLKTAERIAGILEKNPGNLVVVYGSLHTAHEQDLNSETRKKGYSTMIVDPGLGKEDLACTPVMSPTVCSILPQAKEWLDQQIDRNPHPNRYQIPDLLNEPGKIIKREYSPAPAPQPSSS